MNAPARQQNQEIGIFDILRSPQATDELARIAGRSIDAERFAMIATTTIKAKWADIGNCNPHSIFVAVLEAAQLNLDTSVAANEFYFVPFKGDCTGMLGYRGMLRLGYRSGAVEKMDARLVHSGDEFDFVDGHEGPKWTHRPYWQTGKDKGPIMFAYAYAILPNGHIVFKVADQDRIKSAKEASKAKNTWNKHPDAMTVKTAVRELWKWLPKDKIEARVLSAINDDAVRSVEGMTSGRVSADWARAEFDLPPESMGELSPAAGLEPDGDDAT